ncbi:MAG: efflux RND transporter periplasmic adaptor subunit [Bacteroidota bacterium]
MNKKQGNILYIFLFISCMLFYSCGNKKKSEEKSQSAQGAKGPVPVEGMVLVARSLSNEVRTSGTVMAFEEVELHPETSGRVTKILFTEGSKVNKGDLLIKINDEDLQAQLGKTVSQIKLSEEQLKRQDQLLKISATSQQEYDITANQLSSLKADADIIRSSINKTEIRAPFKGTIGLRYVSEGSYVTPASQIAAIQNIDPVKIDFSVPEKYSSTVKKGDVVVLTNDESGKDFKGKVYAVEPKIDEGTRTLKIRAICENNNGEIVPGSFVKVVLQLDEINDALLVPTQVLIPVLKGQNIYVARNGAAQAVPVKTGIRTDSEIQITEGLQAGDTILTKGIISLKPNTPVNVKVKSSSDKTIKN